MTRDAMVEFHRARGSCPITRSSRLPATSRSPTRASWSRPSSGQWKKAGVAQPAETQPPAPGPAKVYLVARPNSVQTSLFVGTQSLTRTDPDYVPLTVANAVIGGGTMGRLFRHLREDKGYTYGTHSDFGRPDYRGQLVRHRLR